MDNAAKLFWVKHCSLLLLLASVLLARGGGNWSSDGGLLVLGDGKSLAIGGQFEDRVSGLSASPSVRMVGHVGGDLTVGVLHLQPLDLAVALDVVVFEESLGSLAVLVLDLLGLGVDLLLSLPLATVEGDEGVDAALGLETSLLKGHGLLKRGSVEHESVDGELNLGLDLGSTQTDRSTVKICSQ